MDITPNEARESCSQCLCRSGTGTGRADFVERKKRGTSGFCECGGSVPVSENVLPWAGWGKQKNNTGYFHRPLHQTRKIPKSTRKTFSTYPGFILMESGHNWSS